MSAYRRDFDEINCMSFWIKDDELSIKKGFHSEPVCNERYPNQHRFSQ